MSFFGKARLWIARKAAGDIEAFSTTSGQWYKDNGYRILADRYGYGNVTQNAAMSCSALFGGIKIISEDVSSLPFFVLRKDRKDPNRSERLYDHPLYVLLHDKPNPEMTAMEFRESITGYAALTGTGYARIVRNPSGAITALWPIQPADITKRRNQQGYSYYQVRASGMSQDVPASDIFRLNSFGLTGESGFDLLKVAQRAIGLMASQNDYASKYFSNDHTPGIVLEHPGDLGPEGIQNVKDAWKASVQSHDVAVTQEGMKTTVIGRTNRESQLIEARVFQILEICRYLRIKPHKLAELSRATFSNIGEQNVEHYTETIRPWCERWESAAGAWLLTDAERADGTYLEHSVEAFMRGNFEQQSVGYSRYQGTGTLSINEVRAYMNLNPIEGGDKHRVPLNMADVAEAADMAATLTTQPAPAAQKVNGLWSEHATQ